MKSALLAALLFFTVSIASAEIYSCQGVYSSKPCKDSDSKALELPELSRVETQKRPEARGRLTPTEPPAELLPEPSKISEVNNAEASLREQLNSISAQIQEAKSGASRTSEKSSFAKQTQLETKLKALCARVLNGEATADSTNFRICKELRIEARNITR